MYTENFRKDFVLFFKALLSNQIARYMPAIYVKLTGQTGRGQNESSPDTIANYYFRCLEDYRKILKLSESDFSHFLKDKTILEYGPGDILGIALLLYAFGADTVHCVDRFSLSSLSEKNIRVYKSLLNMLDKKKRDRAETAFCKIGDPGSGFDRAKILYRVAEHGLSGSNQQYDLILSRAVLEHVNNLKKTMLDIKQNMKINGTSLHLVDLKSHGLDRYTEFDFLSWPPILYDLMYSHKGFPNRWRVPHYKKSAEEAGLKIKQLTPTGKIDKEKMNLILRHLDKDFRNINQEELSWKGFWMQLDH